ncbi:MAG: hypothetical protein AAFU71_03075, partial [Cyanobacteria bacterium J06632_22]
FRNVTVVGSAIGYSPYGWDFWVRSMTHPVRSMARHMGSGLVKGLLTLGILLCLVSCSTPEPVVSPVLPTNPPPQTLSPRAAITLVKPPPVLAELDAFLQDDDPEVTILSPKADDILTDTTVRIRLRVKNLPIYIDNTWQLGPHLHVLLDNQQSYPVYDISDPLVLSGLTPGSHSLRVIAAKPWHESFKNIGAYAQTTFHVFAKTGENQPSPEQPALIYSQPEGNYGAEPILVDFHLSDVPLHMIAQESDLDTIKDWHLRCTVNGDSLRIDTWEPVYLTGLKPGQNWVQLSLEDENDQPIDNTFNNTVRLINYQPGGDDTLPQLMRGELTAAELMGIVDPNYVPPAAPPAAAPPIDLNDAAANDETESVAAPLDNSPEPSATEPEGTDVPQAEGDDVTGSSETEPRQPTGVVPVVPDRADPLETRGKDEAAVIEPEDEVAPPRLEPPEPQSPTPDTPWLKPDSDNDDAKVAPRPQPGTELPSSADSSEPGVSDEANRQNRLPDDASHETLNRTPEAPPDKASEDSPEDLTTIEAKPLSSDDDAPSIVPAAVDIPKDGAETASEETALEKMALEETSSEDMTAAESAPEPEPTTSQRLFKRLYDYRDRSLETYGNR